MPQILRYLAPGVLWAFAGFIFAIPLLIWGTDKAPEFYGSFTAAIVAAVAVIAGTYYQAELARRRDDNAARQSQIAEALSLFSWLEHAIGEMKFIEELLESFRDRTGEEEALDMPADQYREAISSRFMEELRDRAERAARLSPALAAQVAPTLYKTFLAVDRIYRFRGTPANFKIGRQIIEGQLVVARRRIETLEQAQAHVNAFLASSGAAPTILDE